MRDQLAALLNSLEVELRVQGRWERQSPPDEALRSTQPFAFDSLGFDQWLQWIFVARLNHLLVHQLPLPGRCAVRPMAEEVYAPDDAAAARLIAIGDDKPVRFVKQARQLGIAERFTIWKGRDDIPQVLQGGDLLLHPAYYENTGTVLLEAVVAEGHVADQILEHVESKSADLVVVGIHGASSLTLGSTARRLAKECPVPLLTVRVPEGG